MKATTRSWVRVDENGDLVLTWQIYALRGLSSRNRRPGWQHGGSRPLTRVEIVLWRVFRRKPSIDG